jgi:hypothetical protein
MVACRVRCVDMVISSSSGVPAGAQVSGRTAVDSRRHDARHGPRPTSRPGTNPTPQRNHPTAARSAARTAQADQLKSAACDPARTFSAAMGSQRPMQTGVGSLKQLLPATLAPIGWKNFQWAIVTNLGTARGQPTFETLAIAGRSATLGRANVFGMPQQLTLADRAASSESC